MSSVAFTSNNDSLPIPIGFEAQLIVSGFAEHITRYHQYFRQLAAPPSSLHITAFDQRGHGRTSQAPLTADSAQVVEWKKQGKTVNLEKNGKRKTGGWAKAMPDMEWFVKRESVLAKGKKVFLYGHSMVSWLFPTYFSIQERLLISSGLTNLRAAAKSLHLQRDLELHLLPRRFPFYPA